MMDYKRAKEILNNKTGSIEVLYQGEPVWLEDVKDTNTASVRYIESHDITEQDTIEVPVYKLIETENKTR